MKGVEREAAVTRSRRGRGVQTWKRTVAKLAAQVSMFIFIVVLASVLRPYMIKHDSTPAWALMFLIILGLLMLPGWLFRRYWPVKRRIVKIHKSLPLPGGGTLYVSRRVGPVDGFKGFHATAVHSPHPERPPSTPAWTIIRWIAVLPVTVAVYTLTSTTLIGLAEISALPISDIAAYTVLFAVSTLAAVFVGALTAPTRHVQTACLLVLLLAAAFVYLTARVALSGIHDTSLPPVVLGQMAAGLAATFLVGWRDRRLRPVKQELQREKP